MMSGLVIAGFVVGIVVSVVILFIITAIITIFLLLTVLKVMLGVGDSDNRKFKLDNGDEVTEYSGLFGDKTYVGTLGKTYSTDDGGKTFSED